MRVCVLGAGVVGLTTAYYLARAGAQVTLVERSGAPGQGASYANGGQLSYSYVAPLAAPGALAGLLGGLLRTDRPLRLRPRLDPRQWRWGSAFLRSCTGGAGARPRSSCPLPISAAPACASWWRKSRSSSTISTAAS
jgi:D-amino-acid dehydrogenase